MIPGTPRLPLVGHQPRDQVRIANRKTKTFLRMETARKLASFTASRWSDSELRNIIGKETQHPIIPSVGFRLILQ